MAWGKNGTPSTLGGTADIVEVTDLSGSKFNQFMYHGIFSGTGTVQHNIRFDGLSTSIYAARFTEDGLSDVTQVNQGGLNASPTAPAVSEDTFMIGHVCAISGEEKLFMGWISFSTASGASVTSRAELTGKSTNTTTLDQLSIVNVTAGSDMASTTNLSVLGSDITPVAGTSATISDGAVFYETDTNKSYVLNGSTWTEL